MCCLRAGALRFYRRGRGLGDRAKHRADSRREEEQPTRFYNPQAMPPRTGHDECSIFADQRRFDRTIVIGVDEQPTFEHAERFISCGMAFPAVGMNRSVVGELGES